MELHQVRYFLAVSRTLNFTRAAEECHVSQPSLSLAVQKLEAELGGPLFRRERRRTHLTELGRTMVPFLQQCYDSAVAAKAQAASYGQAEYAPLRVGLSLTIQMADLAPVFHALANVLPGLELEIVRAGADKTLGALEAGDIDLAVTAKTAADWSRFDIWPLFEEKLVLLVARNHALARRNRIQLSDLAGERLIFRPYCETADRVAVLLKDHDIDPFRCHRISGDDDLAALIERGLGVAVAPDRIARAKGLQAVTIADLDIVHAVQLYSVAGRQRSPAATGLMRLARSADWSNVRH